ncbi:hypothetical protein [Lysinibacillus piscis]|uniref:Alpha/beta hydrolase n=1 Tax=Lysinibacillus piscis TaxID=2518931 RepID=A0ABQ5NJ69_9BACI|nr:hypothetical protein [Lysinibacillus sp. KH24]GLC88117.1 hypothetical protein LYSBPC_12440 [Lysinibacillus sp. KH24]
MKIKPKTNQYNDITYHHFDNQSDKICFMFSGTGYTYDKPLLYYPTLLMLELGYNVVHVCYEFQQSQFEQTPEEISKMVQQVVQPIVNYCIASKSYTEAIYFGKSLGTLPIVDFYIQQQSDIPCRFILLTPLLSLTHVMQNLQNKHAFIAIGTNDPHYSQERVAALSSHQLTVIDNADHSLEIIGDIDTSITICHTLVNALKTYLQQ